MMDERLYYVPFVLSEGVGPSTFAKLLLCFPSAEKAYHTSEKELKASGLTEKNFFALGQVKKTFDIHAYLSELEKKHISFITYADSNYPPLLKEIKNAPCVLFVKGNPDALISKNSIAVVGTRNMSICGEKVTDM